MREGQRRVAWQLKKANLVGIQLLLEMAIMHGVVLVGGELNLNRLSEDFNAGVFLLLVPVVLDLAAAVAFESRSRSRGHAA